MTNTLHTPTQSVESVWPDVLAGLGKLLAGIRIGKAEGRDFYEAACLLECLPLATNEYGLIRARLRNANRYWRCDERGAATWEICTLMKQLQNHSIVKTVEPRRRRARTVGSQDASRVG